MPDPTVPPFVLISGDEALLVDRAVSRTLTVLRKQDPDVERREASAAGLTTADFADMVAPSLFAEPRAVVVRGAHEAVKDLVTELIDYLRDPVEGVTLVVQHGGGARNKNLVDALRAAKAAVFDCEKVKPGDRVGFVRREIKSAGGTTTAEAAAALVEAVGADLRELASAANQLVADTGGLVDESAVARYYRGKAEVSGFAIADRTIAGELPEALESLRWAFITGVPAVLIADALADGIRTLAKVAGARGSSYALAGELGMPPWKIEKAQRAVRGWSAPGMVKAVAAVSVLNAEVKGVAVDVEYALERAVTQLVEARAMR
ncbi:MAG: DNA polymerase III subunit delta [Nakamurella sp.]